MAAFVREDMTLSLARFSKGSAHLNLWMPEQVSRSSFPELA
jgi:hypothetical protein